MNRGLFPVKRSWEEGRKLGLRAGRQVTGTQERGARAKRHGEELGVWDQRTEHTAEAFAGLHSLMGAAEITSWLVSSGCCSSGKQPEHFSRWVRNAVPGLSGHVGSLKSETKEEKLKCAACSLRGTMVPSRPEWQLLRGEADLSHSHLPP